MNGLFRGSDGIVHKYVVGYIGEREWVRTRCGQTIACAKNELQEQVCENPVYPEKRAKEATCDKCLTTEVVADDYYALREYNANPNATYPVLCCHPDWGGCGAVHGSDKAAAPAQCVCGASKGVFPYIEYSVFGKKS